jgi:hypothetical protein
VFCEPQGEFLVAGTGRGVHQAVDELSALYRRALGGALTASTAEGPDAGEYARLVDFTFQPVPLAPDDTRPARTWVLGLIDQITAVREARVHARAARLAR